VKGVPKRLKMVIFKVTVRENKKGDQKLLLFLLYGINSANVDFLYLSGPAFTFLGMVTGEMKYLLLTLLKD